MIRGVVFLLSLIWSHLLFAQVQPSISASVPNKDIPRVYFISSDSSAENSCLPVLGLEDSYLTPDPSRPSQFIDSLRSILIFEGGKVQAWLAYAESLQLLRESEMDSELVRVQAQLPNVARPTRDRWILVNVGILFLLSCVLRLLFPADVALIVKVYFDQSLLGQINKEENMFNSWPYVFFYALFGFAAGLFIYLGMLSGSLGGAEAQWNARHGGVSLYLLLSLGVLVLFALKIVVTRFMGFVFDSARLLRRYITILFLAYFNAGIVFLLFAGAMSLMPFEQAPLLFWTGLICIALPFTLRLTYAGYELLSNYRFPKFYLIVYLCTLEIAPVLILIKVLYR